MVTVAFFLDLLVPNIPSECWQHPHPTPTHSHFSKLESLESSLKDSGCGRGHRALVVGKQVAGSPLGGWGGKRNRSTKTSYGGKGQRLFLWTFGNTDLRKSHIHSWCPLGLWPTDTLCLVNQVTFWASRERTGPPSMFSGTL